MIFSFDLNYNYFDYEVIIKMTDFGVITNKLSVLKFCPLFLSKDTFFIFAIGFQDDNSW